MSLEANKRVVANFVEVCQNRHDLAAADAIFHPDFVNHYAPEGRELAPTPRPAGGFQAFYGMLLRAFPDATMEIGEQLAERDLVATRKTLRGTHLASCGGCRRPATGWNGSSSTSAASATACSWSTGPTWTSRRCARRCARATRRAAPDARAPTPRPAGESRGRCAAPPAHASPAAASARACSGDSASPAAWAAAKPSSPSAARMAASVRA